MFVLFLWVLGIWIGCIPIALLIFLWDAKAHDDPNVIPSVIHAVTWPIWITAPIWFPIAQKIWPDDGSKS